MNNDMFCDFESYSDVSVVKVGALAYAQHPSTEGLCMSYRFGINGVTKIWIAGEPIPPEVKEHIESGGIVRSWNVEFEFAIFNFAMTRVGWPLVRIPQCRCTKTDAMALTLPASLAQCGGALQLDNQKMSEGKALIKLLCLPQKPTKKQPLTRLTPQSHPELFEELYKYCIRDTDVEVDIFTRLPMSIDKRETALFHQCMGINLRGLPIDEKLVDACLEAKQKYVEVAKARILELTDGKVVNSNSIKQCKDWLLTEGVDMPGMDKLNVAKQLKKDLAPEVREFLELRVETAKTPVKKVDRAKLSLCEDGTIKNNLIFTKATTRRYAGSGFQLHNLPKASADNVDELIGIYLNGKTDGRKVFTDVSKLIRPLISTEHLEEEQQLIVSDFSGIENRVITWLAGDAKALQVIKNGEDAYKEVAKGIYGLDSIDDVTKEQRQLGKIAVLTCCFGGGAKMLVSVCQDQWDIKISEAEAKAIVKGYRDVNSKIVSLWYDLERAFIKATSQPGTVVTVSKFKIRTYKGYLFVRLPSGGHLAYYDPKVMPKKTPWGQMKITFSHIGINTYTKKWERLFATPGRLAENVTQAVARDVLAFSMMRVENGGFNIIGCIHDEIICLEDMYAKLEDMEALMKKVPEWAKGLPIDVEGYTAKRFRK